MDIHVIIQLKSDADLERFKDLIAGSYVSQTNLQYRRDTCLRVQFDSSKEVWKVRSWGNMDIYNQPDIRWNDIKQEDRYITIDEFERRYFVNPPAIDCDDLI